jgi:hypothetical protein
VAEHAARLLLGDAKPGVVLVVELLVWEPRERRPLEAQRAPQAVLGERRDSCSCPALERRRLSTEP